LRSNLLVICLLALLWPAWGWAQEQTDSGQAVRVGVYVSPPFVTETDGKFSGMAFELWEALAGTLGLQSKYEVYPTVGDLVEATADGKVDVALTNLTITKGRAERIDFSYP
jgi:ABC-type amino acid transport substrate-binding protein